MLVRQNTIKQYAKHPNFRGGLENASKENWCLEIESGGILYDFSQLHSKYTTDAIYYYIIKPKYK